MQTFTILPGNITGNVSPTTFLSLATHKKIYIACGDLYVNVTKSALLKTLKNAVRVDYIIYSGTDSKIWVDNIKKN